MSAVQSTFAGSVRHDQMLDELREILRDRSAKLPAEDFTLRGLWRVDYRYRPNSWERDLSYTMMFAHTLWQGCCYVDYQAVEIDDRYLGQDAREVRPADHATEIAILDSAFAMLGSSPARVYEFEGNAEQKASERARVVVSEVARMLGGDARGARVLQVGVMGTFVHQLLACGAEVMGSDFDPKLVGSTLAGAPVRSGTETLRLVRSADVVLATGMTLSTGTLADIIEVVRTTGGKLVLFAATGANFGEEYCRRFGVDLVLSELQPQYMFQGRSIINAFCREPDQQV